MFAQVTGKLVGSAIKFMIGELLPLEDYSGCQRRATDLIFHKMVQTLAIGEFDFSAVPLTNNFVLLLRGQEREFCNFSVRGLYHSPHKDTQVTFYASNGFSVEEAGQVSHGRTKTVLGLDKAETKVVLGIAGIKKFLPDACAGHRPPFICDV